MGETLLKIFITGGTGFVGTALLPQLIAQGHEPVLLIRPAEEGSPVTGGAATRVVVGEAQQPGPWWDLLGECDAAINLAGYPVFRRWTPRVKTLLRASRIDTTRNLVRAIPEDRPFTLVSASGIGIFGDSGERVLDEFAPPGTDFLSELALEWEAEAFRARDRGVRVATTRFGIVLGAGGGALSQFVKNARWLVNGPLGSGRQWLAWIHLDDVTRGIQHILEKPDQEGPFNFVAPQPVRQGEFARTLGRVLHRPAILPTPALALRLVLGEFGKISLFSQRARPAKLEAAGFDFRFPELEPALRQILTPAAEYPQ